MKAIFLSDISTADGRYLENFVFNPGVATAGSTYIFPREKPTREDWDTWIDFWHGYTTTGGKLKMPLGNWINANPFNYPLNVLGCVLCEIYVVPHPAAAPTTNELPKVVMFFWFID